LHVFLEPHEALEELRKYFRISWGAFKHSYPPRFRWLIDYALTAR
jgi:hypothetical protein